MKLSYEQLKEKLRGMMPGMYIMEMYDDHVICEKDSGGYCKVEYTLDASDNVTIKEPVEVQREYVPVKAAVQMQFASAASEKTSEDYGYKWRVQIIETGPDKQGRVIYPHTVLKAAIPLYEGARVFALSEAQHTPSNNPFGKSVKDIVGWISDVAENAKGLEGTVNILKTAAWLRDMLVDSWEQGKQDLVALSHDIMGSAVMKGSAREVKQIVKVDSVDVVYDPIGGGKFLRMAAAGQAGQKEAEMLEKLLAALKAQRPDIYATIEAKVNDRSITEDEVMQLVASSMSKKEDQDGFIEKLTAAMKADSGQAGMTAAVDEAKKILDQARLVACATTLKDELKDSNLPELSRERIKKQFDGKVFETTALQAAIKDEKEFLDKLTAGNVVSGAGDIRMQITETEPERLQAAMDKLFGVDVDEKFKDVPAMESLRAGYTRLTGDLQVSGRISPEHAALGLSLMKMMRLPAAYSSSSFTYVLGNSMFRRLIKEYRAVDYKESILISYNRNAQDFKTMEIIQIGYFGDLPDVDPETGDYQEITMPTDIEATYSLNQKGVILSVTRKAVVNDDLKSVSQLVSKLGRAARRTHARRAWNKIISNATFKGDSTALFHANHGNLGAVALTNDATGIATLTARLQAMYAQAEQDSAEILGLEPLYIWVPRALVEIAMGLNSAWPGVAGGNPHAARFGANHERIINIPLFTDATDWGLIADKNEVEILEAAYLNGRTEPELFVADNPLVGQMFLGDKLQYKQRHEYEFEIADYRGVDKSVVAGG